MIKEKRRRETEVGGESEVKKEVGEGRGGGKERRAK